MSSSRLTREHAIALVSGPFGRELARVPELYAAPIHTRGSDGKIENGTTFFLDCGSGVFGVTAGHVFDQLAANVRAARHASWAFRRDRSTCIIA